MMSILPNWFELSDGYSGADIRAVAGRSASRPFLESVGGAAPRNICMADVLAVLGENAALGQPEGREEVRRLGDHDGLAEPSSGAEAMSRDVRERLSESTVVAVCVDGDEWPRGLLSEYPIPDRWMGLVIAADGRRR